MRYDRTGPRRRAYPRYDEPYTGWYPGAYWAGAPMFGWPGIGWAGGWPPEAPIGFGGYPDPFTPRRPPRESPAYGRGGDQELRRWAERYGYDIEYSLQPRWGRPRRGPGRYDRGYPGYRGYGGYR